MASENATSEDVRILRVEDIMERGRLPIDGGATIAEAIQKMRANKSFCLVIEPRWDGDAYGIVTARDIVAKAVGAGPRRMNFSEHRVAEIMRKPALLVPANLEVKYAVRLMDETGAGGLLAYDGESVLGTLTAEDVFAKL